MIQLQTDANINLLTLVAIFESHEQKLKSLLSNNIIKKTGYLTWDNQSQIIYLFIAKHDEKKLDYWALRNILQISFNNLPLQDIAIKLESFITQNINLKMIAQLMTEIIIEKNHSQYKLSNQKNLENKRKIKSFTLLVKASDQQLIKAIINKNIIKSTATNLARDLQDMPPNILTSQTYVDEVKTLFKNVSNLKIKVLDKEAIKKLKMNLLLAVNAGSNQEARVVTIEYNGNRKSQTKIGLVGKGIIFDSGGYSLKSWQHLSGMKFDMSGSAIVSATMMGLAQLKPRINVVAICVLTDNRIGQNATLVESVVQSMNGQFVEIEDTDAEGRLVLADGITYALRKLNCSKIITVATLTGSAASALGKWFTAGLTNDVLFYNQFIKSSHDSYERIWQLPVINAHYKIMKDSQVADLSNFPGELSAGMSTAAAFLFAFSEDKPMIHLDIAGTAYDKKRGNGVMVKTLIEALTNEVFQND